MAASTPASKRTPARRTPAKKADPVVPAVPLPDISDIPEELRFESTAYTPEEVKARPRVDLAYIVRDSSGKPVETLRLTARRPGEGFLQLIGLDFVTAANEMATAQACLQFIYGAFDTLTRSTLRRKMYDPNDSLELEHLVDIALTLLKMWGVSISATDQ